MQMLVEQEALQEDDESARSAFHFNLLKVAVVFSTLQVIQAIVKHFLSYY